MIHDKIENLRNYPELKKFFGGIENAFNNTEKINRGMNMLDGETLKANRFSLVCGTSAPFYESHKMYADIHFLLKGQEKIKYLHEDITDKQLDEKADARISYESYEKCDELELKKGEFCVFFPGEPHQTGNVADKNDINVEKIVFKLKMA